MMAADHEVDDVRQEMEALRAAFASEQEKAVKSPEEKMQILQIKMIVEQFKNMLPTGSFIELLNLIAWSIGAFILFMGVGKIAQIGMSLIK